MKVEQIYTGCLAEAAYYIESNGEAAIIDPLREIEPYLAMIEERDVELKYILETHFHADFVSGHVDLAAATGARIVYGPNATPQFDAHIAADGEELKLGDVVLKVLHTPGHTMESSCYLLHGENGKEHSIFTGDTLFIGDVGRPDLAQKGKELTQEDLAGYLFDSLREKVMTLPDEVIVYPGHGAGSACGKNMSSETWDTLQHQKASNYALRADMTREEFIKEVTEGLLPPPQYFAKNAKLNKVGYDDVNTVIRKGMIPLSVDDVKAEMDINTLIMDVRSPQAFAMSHIPEAINIGLDGNFAPWVGALIEDIDRRIVLVAPEERVEEAVTRLARVGYDNAIGFLKGGIETWRESGQAVSSVDSLAVVDLEKNIQDLNILDVRKASEFQAEHVENAENKPLDYINDWFSEIDKDKTYHVHCKSGYRSMVAISILKSRGYDNLVDVKGGFEAIRNTDIKTTDYVCPSTINN